MTSILTLHKHALSLPFVYHLFTGSREEHPGAVPILSVHDEIVIECDAEATQETVRWLGDTLRGVVEDVLGLPELAGHDILETYVVGSWEA
jgi:hypothetical protein